MASRKQKFRGGQAVEGLAYNQNITFGSRRKETFDNPIFYDDEDIGMASGMADLEANERTFDWVGDIPEGVYSGKYARPYQSVYTSPSSKLNGHRVRSVRAPSSILVDSLPDKKSSGAGSYRAQTYWCIAVVIFLVLCTIAAVIGVAIYFGVYDQQASTDTGVDGGGGTSSTAGPRFELRLTLSNIAYSPSLGNVFGETFKSVAYEVEQNIDQLYVKSNLSTYYDYLDVLVFRNDGGFARSIAEVYLKAEHRDTNVVDSAQIAHVIKVAAENNEMGRFVVIKNSISAIDLNPVVVPTSSLEVKEYQGSFQIANVNYTEELANPSTPVYQTTAAQVTTELTKIYQDQYGDALDYVEVTGFAAASTGRRKKRAITIGGLTVYFKIVLKPVVEVQDVQPEVVQKTLVDAVETNNFQNFVVEKESITVEVIVPATAAPTTKAPTTAAPTTDLPTTKAPTTAAPTTKAPTTAAPTTKAPTTAAPTTKAPTTAAPTTKAPTTAAPATEAPTTSAPTTEAPTTAAPTTKAPTTKAPTTEAPTTTEEPTTKSPTTAASTTEPPTTKASTTDTATTKAPTTEAPTTKAPTTVSSSTESQTTQGPTTLSQTTVAPTTTIQPEETTTAEVETTTLPGETTTAEVEVTTPPEETTTVEVETTTLPGETTTAEVEVTTPPEETTTVEVKTTTLPEETTTAEVETTTLPGETTTAEVETTTLPGETTTAEVKTTTQPGETTTAEVETTTTIKETTTAEVETTTLPEETTTAEVETTTQPGETTTAEVETTTLPGETTTAEVKTTTLPRETTTAEVETTTLPGETTTAEVETTTQPGETTTAEVETTTQPGETTTAEIEVTTPPEETTTAEVEVTTPPLETTTVEVEVTTPPQETTTAGVETTTQQEETTTLEVKITTEPKETTTEPIQTTSKAAVTTPAADTTTIEVATQPVTTERVIATTAPVVLTTVIGDVSSIDISFKSANTFTEELNNPLSATYRQLEQDVVNLVTASYTGTTQGNNIQKIVVLGFQPGSIIVNLRLLLKKAIFSVEGFATLLIDYINNHPEDAALLNIDVNSILAGVGGPSLETTAKPTDAPVTDPPVTDAPKKTTPKPVVTTKAPVVTTPDQPQETTQPGLTTTQASQITTAQLETTVEPKETTLAPVETTTKTAEVTTAEVETTPQPLETTTMEPVDTTTVVEKTTPSEVKTTTQPVEADTTTQPMVTTPELEETTTEEADTTTQPMITTPELEETTTEEADTTTQPMVTTPESEASTTVEIESTTPESVTDKVTTVEAETTPERTTRAQTTPRLTTEPTTAVPTTQQPTTELPTTAEPTTQQPTTELPTTAEPTTQAPTTKQPTTEGPTTEPTTTMVYSTTTAGEEVLEYDVEFTITNMNFSVDLNDTTSAYYNSTMVDLEALVLAAYSGSMDDIESIEIMGIRQGSIIVMFRVKLKSGRGGKMNEEKIGQELKDYVSKMPQGHKWQIDSDGVKVTGKPQGPPTTTRPRPMTTPRPTRPVQPTTGEPEMTTEDVFTFEPEVTTDIYTDEPEMTTEDVFTFEPEVTTDIYTEEPEMTTEDVITFEPEVTTDIYTEEPETTEAQTTRRPRTTGPAKTTPTRPGPTEQETTTAFPTTESPGTTEDIFTFEPEVSTDFTDFTDEPYSTDVPDYTTDVPDYTSEMPDSESTTVVMSTTSGPPLTEFAVSFAISNLNFTEDLLNKSSAAYQYLENALKELLFSVYSNSDIRDDIALIEITGFSSGSVVVNFKIVLKETSAGVKADTVSEGLAKYLEENPAIGDLFQIVRESISAELVSAVTTPRPRPTPTKPQPTKPSSTVAPLTTTELLSTTLPPLTTPRPVDACSDANQIFNQAEKTCFSVIQGLTLAQNLNDKCRELEKLVFCTHENLGKSGYNCHPYDIDYIFIKHRAYLESVVGFNILKCIVNATMFYPWIPPMGDKDDTECDKMDSVVNNAADVCRPHDFSAVVMDVAGNMTRHGWEQMSRGENWKMMRNVCYKFFTGISYCMLNESVSSGCSIMEYFTTMIDDAEYVEHSFGIDPAMCLLVAPPFMPAPPRPGTEDGPLECKSPEYIVNLAFSSCSHYAVLINATNDDTQQCRNMSHLLTCLYRHAYNQHGCHPLDVDSIMLGNRRYLEMVFNGFNLVECLIDDYKQLPPDGSLVVPGGFSCDKVQDIFNLASTPCANELSKLIAYNRTCDFNAIRPYYLGMGHPGQNPDDAWLYSAEKCQFFYDGFSYCMLNVSMRAGCSIVEYFTALLDGYNFVRGKFDIDPAMCYLVLPAKPEPEPTPAVCPDDDTLHGTVIGACQDNLDKVKDARNTIASCTALSYLGLCLMKEHRGCKAYDINAYFNTQEFSDLVGDFDPLICVPTTEPPRTTPSFTRPQTTPKVTPRATTPKATPRATTPKATVAPTRPVVTTEGLPVAAYTVEFRVKNLNFTDDLLDAWSDGYQQLESYFQNLLSSAYDNSTLGDSIAFIEILGFSPGSIIVNFRIVLKADAAPVALDIGATLIDYIKANPSISKAVDIDEQSITVTKEMLTTESPDFVTTDYPEFETTEYPEVMTTEEPYTTERPEVTTIEVTRPVATTLEPYTTEFPEFETTEFPEFETTDYPEFETTDYPEFETTDYPEFETTEFPEFETTEALETTTLPGEVTTATFLPEFDVEFKVTNLNFTNDLLNKSSDSFKFLQNSFQKLLTELYANSNLGGDVAYIEIIGFRPGSVVVAFRIVLKEEAASVPDVDVSQAIADYVTKNPDVADVFAIDTSSIVVSKVGPSDGTTVQPTKPTDRPTRPTVKPTWKPTTPPKTTRQPQTSPEPQTTMKPYTNESDNKCFDREVFLDVVNMHCQVQLNSVQDTKVPNNRCRELEKLVFCAYHAMRQFKCDPYDIDYVILKNRREMGELFGGFNVLNCIVNVTLFKPWVPKQGNDSSLDCDDFTQVVDNAPKCRAPDFRTEIAKMMEAKSPHGWKGMSQMEEWKLRRSICYKYFSELSYCMLNKTVESGCSVESFYDAMIDDADFAMKEVGVDPISCLLLAPPFMPKPTKPDKPGMEKACSSPEYMLEVTATSCSHYSWLVNTTTNSTLQCRNMANLLTCLYRQTYASHGCHPLDVDSIILGNRQYLEQIFRGFNLMECLLDDDLPRLPPDGSLVVPGDYSCDNIEKVYGFAENICKDYIMDFLQYNKTCDFSGIRSYYIGMGHPGSEPTQEWYVNTERCRYFFDGVSRCIANVSMKAGCSLNQYYTTMMDNYNFFHKWFNLDPAMCYLVAPPTPPSVGECPDVMTLVSTASKSCTRQIGALTSSTDKETACKALYYLGYCIGTHHPACSSEDLAQRSLEMGEQGVFGSFNPEICFEGTTPVITPRPKPTTPKVRTTPKATPPARTTPQMRTTPAGTPRPTPVKTTPKVTRPARTTPRPTRPQPTTPREMTTPEGPTGQVAFDAEVRLQSQNFTDDLLDSTSDAYMELESSVKMLLFSAYGSSKITDDIEDIKILGFREGSIIVIFRLIFKESVKPSETNVNENQVAEILVTFVRENPDVADKFNIDVDSISANIVIIDIVVPTTDIPGPDFETTDYPEFETTDYPEFETTDYPEFETTDYPEFETTDYPEFETTDYPEFETTPRATDEATTPRATEEATTPRATEEATTPRATEEATTPRATEEATTPRATEEATTPRGTEEATTPRATEEATTPRATEEPTTIAAAGQVAFDVEVKLENSSFTSDLLDPNSDAYQQLEGGVKALLLSVYGSSTLANDIENIEILGFREGSIIVLFRLIFKETVRPSDKNVDDVKVRDTLVEFVQANPNVTEELNIKIDVASISATEVFIPVVPATTDSPDPEFETTDYPEFETTDYPEFETTDYPEFETTDYPEFETTDYPEFETTDYPEFETTDYPEFETTEQPEFETTEQPDFETTTIEQTTFGPTQAITAAFRVTNLNFTDDLRDSSTDAYKYLETIFNDLLTTSYSDSEYADSFAKVEILGFSPGSVVVTYRVILTVDPNEKPMSAMKVVGVFKRYLTGNKDIAQGLAVDLDSISPVGYSTEAPTTTERSTRPPRTTRPTKPTTPSTFTTRKPQRTTAPALTTPPPKPTKPVAVCMDIQKVVASANSYCKKELSKIFLAANIRSKCRGLDELVFCIHKSMKQYGCSPFDIDYLMIRERENLSNQFGFNILSCIVNATMFEPWVPPQGVNTGLDCTDLSELLANAEGKCSGDDTRTGTPTTINPLQPAGWKKMAPYGDWKKARDTCYNFFTGISYCVLNETVLAGCSVEQYFNTLVTNSKYMIDEFDVDPASCLIMAPPFMPELIGPGAPAPDSKCADSDYIFHVATTSCSHYTMLVNETVDRETQCRNMANLLTCLYRQTYVRHGCHPLDIDTIIIRNRKYLEQIFRGLNLVECLLDDDFQQYPQDGGLVLPGNFTCRSPEKLYDVAFPICKQTVVDFFAKNETCDFQALMPYYLGMGSPGKYHQQQAWNFAVDRCSFFFDGLSACFSYVSMRAGCSLVDYYTMLIDNSAVFKNWLGLDVAMCYLVSPPEPLDPVPATTPAPTTCPDLRALTSSAMIGCGNFILEFSSAKGVNDACVAFGSLGGCILQRNPGCTKSNLDNLIQSGAFADLLGDFDLTACSYVGTCPANDVLLKTSLISCIDYFKEMQENQTIAELCEGLQKLGYCLLSFYPSCNYTDYINLVGSFDVDPSSSFDPMVCFATTPAAMTTTKRPEQTTLPPVTTSRPATQAPVETTLRPETTTTEAPKPIVFEGDFKVSNLNFSQDLLNETSEEYKQLAETFENLLAAAYNQSNLSGDIAYIEILGFSQGSVVVLFRIVFKPRVTATESPVTLSPGSTAVPEPSKPVINIENIAKAINDYVTSNMDVSSVIQIDPTSISVEQVTEAPSIKTTVPIKPTTEQPTPGTCPDAQTIIVAASFKCTQFVNRFALTMMSDKEACLQALDDLLECIIATFPGCKGGDMKNLVSSGFDAQMCFEATTIGPVKPTTPAMCPDAQTILSAATTKCTQLVIKLAQSNSAKEACLTLEDLAGCILATFPACTEGDMENLVRSGALSGGVFGSFDARVCLEASTQRPVKPTTEQPTPSTCPDALNVVFTASSKCTQIVTRLEQTMKSDEEACLQAFGDLLECLIAIFPSCNKGNMENLVRMGYDAQMCFEATTIGPVKPTTPAMCPDAQTILSAATTKCTQLVIKLAQSKSAKEACLTLEDLAGCILATFPACTEGDMENLVRSGALSGGVFGSFDARVCLEASTQRPVKPTTLVPKCASNQDLVSTATNQCLQQTIAIVSAKSLVEACSLLEQLGTCIISNHPGCTMTDMEDLVRSGALSMLSPTYDPRDCLALQTTERPQTEAPTTTPRMTTKEIVTRVPTARPTTARATSAPCPRDLDDWTEMLQSTPCMSSFRTAVLIVQSGGFTSGEACRAFMSVLICVRTHHQVELACALDIVDLYTPGMSATVSAYWNTLSIDMCDAELSDDRCSMLVPDLIANAEKSSCLQHATSIYTSYQMEGFGVSTCKSTRDFITCMADYFESCLQYDAAGTVALLRPVIVQELGVDPWRCGVETTLPPVQTTRPPVRTTVLPVETTMPPVQTTRPPIQTTRPPVRTTVPPVETTMPPVQTTRPPVQTTRPPVRTTVPAVETTMPPVQTTTPPVQTTRAPHETTRVPAETTRMPVKTTMRPIVTTPVTTVPPLTTTPEQKTTTEAPPVIVDGEFKVSNLNFSQELLNETSPEFQQLADTFKDLLMDAYNKSAFGEDIAYIEIIGFSAGSVIINFRIVFKPQPVVVTSAPETGTTAGSATGTPSSITEQTANGTTPGRPDPVTKAPVVFPVFSQASILAVLDNYIATKPKITASNGESIAVEIDPASIVVQIVTTTTSTTTTPQPTTTTPKRMTTTPERRTTTSEPTTVLPSTTVAPEGTEVDVEFKIMNQNFTNDLYNKSSDAYKELERQIIELLIQIYGNSSIADLIDSIEITGFAPGSIVVGYKMRVVKKLNQQPLKSSAGEDDMEEEYNEDESELTKMAHRMLHDAAEKRRLGKYSVLLSSIKAKGRKRFLPAGASRPFGAWHPKHEVSGKKWALLGERACQDVTTMFKLENEKCGRFEVIANSTASLREKCRLFTEALGCLVPEAVSSYRCSAGTVKQLLYTSRALMEQWYNFDYVKCLVDEQSFSQISPDAKVQAGLPTDFTCKQPQGLMEMTGCALPVVDLQKNIISRNKDKVCRSFSSLMGCLMTSARLAGCQATDAYRTVLDNLDFIKEKFSGFNPIHCWMTDNDIGVSPTDSPAKLAPTTPAPTKPDSPTRLIPTRSDAMKTTKAPVPQMPPLGFCPGDVFSLVSQVFLTRCSSQYNAFYSGAVQNDVIKACSQAYSMIDCGVKQSTCSRERIINHIRMNALLLNTMFNGFDVLQCIPKTQK